MTHTLPRQQARIARGVGLLFGFGFRLILLGSTLKLLSLSLKTFTLYSVTFSVKDAVLFSGGCFLIIKSLSELYKKILEGSAKDVSGNSVQKNADTPEFRAKPLWVIVQVIITDFVFSLDSVLTAVGLSKNMTLIVTSILVSMIAMLYSLDKISKAIQRYPSLLNTVLLFVCCIGIFLVLEAFKIHITIGIRLLCLVLVSVLYFIYSTTRLSKAG